MISKKQIQAEREGLDSLKGLVEVYVEVAATRMQKVRGAVLQSRQFLQGLLEVFAKVKSAYQADGKLGFSTRPKNNKTVAVFVSANAGLYGDIIDKIFEAFSGYVIKYKPDMVVLGKFGLKMVTDKLPGQLYNYYDFSDEDVETDGLEMVMRYLIQYEKIVVFYGQFKTILTQEAVATSVSGDAVEAEKAVETVDGKKVVRQYLFEPSVKDIAKVFEGEILASIFEQTLHEAQLAKFASRMLALDKSIEEIDKKMGGLYLDSVRLRHKTANKKQLATLSGATLWFNGN